MVWVVAACCIKRKTMAVGRCVYDCCGFPLMNGGVCFRVREEVLEDQSFDHDV